MNYKKSLVYQLFYPPKENAEFPKDEDWYSWDDLEKMPKGNKHDPGETLYIWAKDRGGRIFQAICTKDGHIRYASSGSVADDITHIARLKEKKDEKPS